MAESKEIRQEYSTYILWNTATIREVNSPKIDSFCFIKILRRETHRITRHYSAELQTTKQTLTTSKHSIAFTYGEFPLHLKVRRYKLTLIDRQWKFKKAISTIAAIVRIRSRK